jgi:hypothetical protein
MPVVFHHLAGGAGEPLAGAEHGHGVQRRRIGRRRSSSGRGQALEQGARPGTGADGRSSGGRAPASRRAAAGGRAKRQGAGRCLVVVWEEDEEKKGKIKKRNILRICYYTVFFSGSVMRDASSTRTLFFRFTDGGSARVALS